LKPGQRRAVRRAVRVSPGLTAGGGLKRVKNKDLASKTGFPPASPPGAD